MTGGRKKKWKEFSLTEKKIIRKERRKERKKTETDRLKDGKKTEKKQG